MWFSLVCVCAERGGLDGEKFSLPDNVGNIYVAMLEGRSLRGSGGAAGKGTFGLTIHFPGKLSGKAVAFYERFPFLKGVGAARCVVRRIAAWVQENPRCSSECTFESEYVFKGDVF